MASIFISFSDWSFYDRWQESVSVCQDSGDGRLGRHSGNGKSENRRFTGFFIGPEIDRSPFAVPGAVFIWLAVLSDHEVSASETACTSWLVNQLAALFRLADA